ncbi:MAG: hypothetical protein MR531_06210 [Lachnospiraceae bacterium]|nr:hypothetical protein [Lachnospiraceae bacterium]
MNIDNVILNFIGLYTIIITFSKDMKKNIRKYKWTLSIWISLIILFETWICINYIFVSDELYTIYKRIVELAPDPSISPNNPTSTYSSSIGAQFWCPISIIFVTSFIFFKSVKEAIRKDKVLIVNWAIGIIVYIFILVGAIYSSVVLRDSYPVFIRYKLLWFTIFCYNAFSVSGYLYNFQKTLIEIFCPEKIDFFIKNRTTKCDRNVNCDLNEEISCFLRGGRTVTEVAGYFGVSKKYVSKIKDGLNKKD